MAGKATKSSIPSTNSSTNKDLSCLRCRKKKAKCSKTRPTCTRCSRSNQPCEYPDAPPNLTDLSQKVLTLYDTLRELEGEFLVKYMQSKEDEEVEAEKEKEIAEKEEEIELDSMQSPPIELKSEKKIEPSGWSVSLTNNGLSIHTVTRNLSEYNEFAKVISRQIVRDFGENYLPKQWDPDAEGYFEEESDTEELDEDEYLVTVPIFSTSSILLSEPPQRQMLSADTTSLRRSLLSGDSLISLIQSHFIHMLEHLNERYQFIEQQDTKCEESHHIVILMLQLKSYLPIDYLTNKKLKMDPTDPLTQICILTAYVVSITLLAPMPNKVFPPLTTSLWRDCTEYATMLLIDLILIEGDTTHYCYPIILCSILLGWIDTESDTIIHIALLILCHHYSDWQQQEPAWQILIATLLYLDIYSATFRSKQPQLCGEGMKTLWKAAIHMREPKRWETTYRETGIVLEAKLMSLLQKVISLFYTTNDTHVQERKIDVDEVLTLVRDVELWEEELPDWATWNITKEGLVMHMHLIHNIVKILLFRPFCIIHQEDEQTFTKSTFLDMSLSSADRLTTCLLHVHYGGYWTTAARHLVEDVSKRVLIMFDKDEHIVEQLDKMKQRLK